MSERTKFQVGDRIISTVPGRWENRKGRIASYNHPIYHIDWDDGQTMHVALGTRWALTIADGLRLDDAAEAEHTHDMGGEG